MTSEIAQKRLTLKKLKEACDHHLTHHEFRIESLEMRLAIIEDWLERVLSSAQDDEPIH